MFPTLRRMAVVGARSTKTTTNKLTKTTRRQFGGHHDDHHGPTYMSTKSELPKGDWRDRPMHWDFSRKPTSAYEIFVARNLTGPDDPALKLTKGQFIVHMRRLEREEFADRMFWGRVYGMSALLLAVFATNQYYKPFDVVENTQTEIKYKSIFEVARINGPDFVNPTTYRLRLDEFFKDHDPSTIAKLPKDLQDVYFKHKDEYNDTHASLPPLIQPNANLSPDTIKQQRQALMKQYNLTDKEINHIVRSCDAPELFKQAFSAKTEAELPESAKVALQVAKLHSQQVSQ